MQTIVSRVSSQHQIGIPAWVRKKLGITANSEIAWIEMSPGDISIVARQKESKKDPIFAAMGMLKGKGHDDIDMTEAFLKDKEKEIALEERDI